MQNVDTEWFRDHSRWSAISPLVTYIQLTIWL